MSDELGDYLRNPYGKFQPPHPFRPSDDEVLVAFDAANKATENNDEPERWAVAILQEFIYECIKRNLQSATERLPCGHWKEDWVGGTIFPEPGYCRTCAEIRTARGERRPIGNRFHCHGDIVKNSNEEVLPVNEPLFLIRARDYLAVPMLERYRKVCQQDGGNDYIDTLFDEIIKEFVRFAVDNPTKMKQPGSTRGL